jgi:hypothetical protein
MASDAKTVPVKYLNAGAPGSEDIDTSGGITVEMCTNPTCRALVPTEMIQAHIDGHQADHVHDGGNHPVRPPGTPDQGLPVPPPYPDQGLPPEGQAPPEVSGGAPPQVTPQQ